MGPLRASARSQRALARRSGRFVHITIFDSIPVADNWCDWTCVVNWCENAAPLFRAAVGDFALISSRKLAAALTMRPSASVTLGARAKPPLFTPWLFICA